ncbi:hypothetical protein IBA8403_21480 [Pseudomonas syringae]
MVIAGAVSKDAGGHGKQSYGLLIALSQRQVCNGPSQATIAVVKRMQGYKPEMRDTCPHEWIERRITLTAGKPVEKIFQLLLKSSPRWRFKMHDGSIKPP